MKQYINVDFFFQDYSDYLSVQYFTDNAIDPCIESTYTFIRKVAEQVKVMHQDIQPLKIFNFGGDEVPHGAWINSTKCHELIANNPDMILSTSKLIKEYFVKRVANISNDLGMNLAAWEDGLIGDGDVLYEREGLVNDEVYAYAWQNIWEWGVGSRAYRLANAGYKVRLFGNKV